MCDDHFTEQLASERLPSSSSAEQTSSPVSVKRYLGRLTNGQYKDMIRDNKYSVGKTCRNLCRLDATTYLILMQYPYRRAYYLKHGVDPDALHNVSDTSASIAHGNKLCTENE